MGAGQWIDGPKAGPGIVFDFSLPARKIYWPDRPQGHMPPSRLALPDDWERLRELTK